LRLPKLVDEHLRYLVRINGQVMACLTIRRKAFAYLMKDPQYCLKEAEVVSSSGKHPFALLS
jgi:hypothetical protein